MYLLLKFRTKELHYLNINPLPASLAVTTFVGFSSCLFTVKPVLSGHSKIDKTNVLKTNDSLMKVESIAECFFGAFCNTFDLQ